MQNEAVVEIKKITDSADSNITVVNIMKEKMVAIINKNYKDVCKNTDKDSIDFSLNQAINYITEIEVIIECKQICLNLSF